MSTLYGDRPDDPSIRDREDLLTVFRAGEKKSSMLGIGIEYERLPVSRETGLAVPYDSENDGPSVERFLETLSRDHGWEAQREAGRIIALSRGETRVTLEPGAQVEMSGRIHHGLDTAREELVDFVNLADEVASGMGIAFLGIGHQPFSGLDGIGWVPKERYRIMAPYLMKRGNLALGMMKATAGCQVNLDYTSEEDAMEMLRVATAVSSLVTAMMSNSPLSEGRPNSYMSWRAQIWHHTDPDRTGLLPFALDDSSSYEDYVSYALDVPMLFVVRQGRWVDMTDRTFRSYVSGRTSGLTPTHADWELHLTTLFPEVRLKSYLEVRGSDSTPAAMILAQAAIWKGLLYDAKARAAAWNLVKGIPLEDRLAFHREVPRIGLDASLAGRPALDLARELAGIAAGGLPGSERRHIEPLLSLLEDEGPHTQARTLLQLWEGEWGRDPAALVSHLSPDPSLRRT